MRRVIVCGLGEFYLKRKFLLKLLMTKLKSQKDILKKTFPFSSMTELKSYGRNFRNQK